MYPDGDFVFQQDGAKCHTARETQRLLARECEFIESHNWLPYSPDATAPDYRGWVDAMRVVYADGTPANLDDLRRRIQAWRDELPVERVQAWMRELRPRWEKIPTVLQPDLSVVCLAASDGDKKKSKICILIG